VWSRGHRNVQGLAWTPDGRLIASELGQNAWDELNVIRAGANYGWPEVEGRGGGDRFVDPVAVWSPSDASPSGIAVVDGAVYVAALRGEALWRVPLDGDTVGAPERLLHGAYGRLRAVEVDDEGALWLLTSNRSRGRPREGDDRVVVLTLDDVR
jgi:glucose/arabinose dehydrogenase